MSPNSDIPNNFSYYTQYARPSSIYFYTHNTTLIKYRIGCATLTSHSYYWNAKSTNRSPGPPLARRNPSATYPSTYYHRNNQPIYPTPSTRCSTHRQSNSRPSPYSTYCNRSLCPITCNNNCSHSHNHSPILINPTRSRSSYNSSIRICPSPKSLPTRKRLMAHQAHAFHMVDPSP